MPLLYIKTVLLYWHQVLMKRGPLNVAKVVCKVDRPYTTPLGRIVEFLTFM